MELSSVLLARTLGYRSNDSLVSVVFDIVHHVSLISRTCKNQTLLTKLYISIPYF